MALSGKLAENLSISDGGMKEKLLLTQLSLFSSKTGRQIHTRQLDILFVTGRNTFNGNKGIAQHLGKYSFF